MPMDGVDGAPLLRAEFEGKFSPMAALWQRVRCLSRHLSQRTGAAALKPSFLDRRLPPAKIHSTSWLDGVRGYSSFFVFVHHFQYLFHTRYARAYGSSDEDYWLIQLPVLRLVVVGSPLVNVFLVLSGISLALKPIQLARSQRWEMFFDTMFSSVFRRWLRLYLPIIMVQCCVILMVCMGWYNHAQRIRGEWPYPGNNEESFALRDTNAEQIKHWFGEMAKLVDPFHGNAPGYDKHLWTIPLEFRFSMMLFTILVAFAKLKSHFRMFFVGGLYFYLVMQNMNFESLFVAGMGLAEYLCILDERTKTQPTLPTAAADPEKASEVGNKDSGNIIIWAMTLAFGLHLLSWSKEEDSRRAPGYGMLNEAFKPYFSNLADTFTCIGAVICLFALCSCERLRSPFQTSFAVYLGKISFPLYIIHGAVIRVIGLQLVEAVWSYTGSDYFFWYEFGIILTLCVITPIVIWLSDLVMRYVDTPSVRFGRSLTAKMSVS